jgi:adenine phosphoribosyltransferase
MATNPTTLIRNLIRTIPNHPKPGIMFRDVTTLFKDPQGFRVVVNELVNRYTGQGVDKVLGIEARGFIVGAPLAHQLGVGFVPLRKRGKLPAQTIGHDYALEYGTDRVELHLDAISKGERVVIVDDLIATGGTAEAAVRLTELCGGIVHECAFVVDLPELGGRRRLEKLGHPVFTLVEFEGE